MCLSHRFTRPPPVHRLAFPHPPCSCSPLHTVPPFPAYSYIRMYTVRIRQAKWKSVNSPDPKCARRALRACVRARNCEARVPMRCQPYYVYDNSMLHGLVTTLAPQFRPITFSDAILRLAPSSPTRSCFFSPLLSSPLLRCSPPPDDITR